MEVLHVAGDGLKNAGGQARMIDEHHSTRLKKPLLKTMNSAWWLAVTLALSRWVESGAGSDWEDVNNDPSIFLSAEPVGSRSHQLPVEVIQEPYELIEWSTDVSGGRRALPFPPGLLVAAAVALVAFLFIWKSDRKRLLERLKGRAREVPTAVKPEPEHGLGTGHPKAALSPSTLQELQELLTKLETTRMDVAQRRTALGDVNIPPEYLDKQLFMHLSEKVEGAAEETSDIAAELQATLSDSGLLYVQGKANALQQKIEKLKEEELLGNLEGRAELLYNERISSGGVETEEGARGALDAAFKQCGNFLLSLAALRDIVFDGGPRVITAAHQARSSSD
ncbi:hypothetical protein Efla_006931 [Eimeria flavescens]